MFGGVPQPQISRDGPKRPEMAVFGVFLKMPAGGEKIYYVLLLVTIKIFCSLAQLPQNKVGVPRPPDSDPLT